MTYHQLPASASDRESDKINTLAAGADAIIPLVTGTLVQESQAREAATWVVAAATAELVLGKANPEAFAQHLQTTLSPFATMPRQLGGKSATDQHQAFRVAELADRLWQIMRPTAWEASDGELLGKLFEQSISKQQRKCFGQFYTPGTIVQFLLQRALAPFDPQHGGPFRILDPACGTGDFLVAAAEYLFKIYRSRRKELLESQPAGCWDDRALLERICSEHLVGTDSNPWAVRVAQTRLRMKALALGAATPPLVRIWHGDALRRDQERALPYLKERYQAVIGNPPYGAEFTPEEKNHIARHYELGKGRYDSTALFIERSLELLDEGGRLALVVPHGLTRTGAYAACRALLARKAGLLALLDAATAFPGVALEVIALVAQLGKKTGQVELASLRSGHLQALGAQESAFFRDRPTMPIYVPSDLGKLMTKIERNGQPLRTIARIRRGAGISARHPDLTTAEPGVPVIRGRDIARYLPLLPPTSSSTGQAKALRWFLPSPHPLLARYAAAILTIDHIGYQNIASGIVASMLPGGSLPLDTVNVLEVGETIDPLALLAILNSRLADCYFRLVIANMAQLTVHLDSPTIGSLPICIGEPEPLSRAARALGLARAANCPADRLADLAATADEIVMTQAGLTPAERVQVLELTRPIFARSSRPGRIGMSRRM
ncbi:MAG: N-6 DNA methylase [Cyanobacteria bacterium NC_groundwater_1444_Ag_S-0.65um_54_12]|nr:N-6 DNA methylase [Cyanobacteria bacterium NC_groundwater_1444_Ag_S-0.65um_54_12]